MEKQKYPEYKDSGIEWLGEVPEHWEIDRLKWVLSSLESGQRESGIDWETDHLSIGGEHIGWQGEWLLNTPRYLSDNYYNEMKKGWILEGDVLLVKDGATIGKTALACDKYPQNSAVNEHVFILRPSPACDSAFLFYFIQSKPGQEQILLEIRGAAQPGLNTHFIDVLMFSQPKLNEQGAIAAYLDRETARIDGLIEKKQRQIELLKEKRTALISHTVTKGLDLDAPMKDSGIEWLGEVPEEWEVKRLKYGVNLINQKVDGSNSNLPYTGLEHIESWTGKRVKSNENTNEGQANLYQQGDVLFGKLRPYLAKAYAAREDGLCTGELLVLRPISLLQHFLLKLFINSYFHFNCQFIYLWSKNAALKLGVYW